VRAASVDPRSEESLPRGTRVHAHRADRRRGHHPVGGGDLCRTAGDSQEPKRRVVVVSLTAWEGNNIRDIGSLKYGRSALYSSDGALQVAIANTRYTYPSSTSGFCSNTSSQASTNPFTIDGVAVAVWCTTTFNPSTCPSGRRLHTAGNPVGVPGSTVHVDIVFGQLVRAGSRLLRRLLLLERQRLHSLGCADNVRQHDDGVQPDRGVECDDLNSELSAPLRGEPRDSGIARPSESLPEQKSCAQQPNTAPNTRSIPSPEAK
jgi:hypothetical protein